MATTSKSEKILIGIDNEVIELTGEDKEAFLQERAKDAVETQNRKKEIENQLELRKSAFVKLGLTEEEINAIL